MSAQLGSTAAGTPVHPLDRRHCPVRLRRVHVDGAADNRRNQDSPRTQLAACSDGDCGGDVDRTAVWNVGGAQTRHLGRLCRADLCHRRFSGAIVLAGNRDHSWIFDFLQMDAASDFYFLLDRSARQSDAAHMASPGGRLSLFGDGDAHDSRSGLGSAGRGLRAHRAPRGFWSAPWRSSMRCATRCCRS